MQPFTELVWDYLPYVQNLGRILIHLTVLGYLELVGFGDHNYHQEIYLAD